MTSKRSSAKGRKELEGLALGPWASYRRQELLRMFDELAVATAQLEDQTRERRAYAAAGRVLRGGFGANSIR